MPKLIIQQSDREWTVELVEGSNVVGRASKCQVPVPDTNISREHFEIAVQQGVATLIDKGSMNGTFVNGTRVFERKLDPGDKIQIGQTTLWFEIKKTESGATAAKPKGPPTDTKVKTERNVVSPTAPPKPASSPSNPALAGAKKSEVRRGAAGLVKDYAAWTGGGVNVMAAVPWIGGVVGVVILLVVVYVFFGGRTESASDPGNLMKDEAGFEMADGKPGNWAVRPAGTSTVAIHKTLAHTGKHSMELSKGEAPAETIVDVEFAERFSAGNTPAFEVSTWAKWGSFAGTACLKVTWYQKNALLYEQYSTPVSKASDWVQLKSVFAVPPGADQLKVGLTADGGGGQIYFDDVRVATAAGGDAPKRFVVKDHVVHVAPSGAVILEKGGRRIATNVHLRLENDREGVSSQLLMASTPSQDGENVKVSGEIAHPVSGAPVRYELTMYFLQGQVGLGYEFAAADLQQVDRIVVSATLPKAEKLRAPAEAVSQVEFVVEGEDYQLSYLGRKVKVSLREGNRLVQGFPVAEADGKVSAALLIQSIDRASRKDPRDLARLKERDEPVEALEILRKAQSDSTLDENVQREISGMIRALEQREANDWRDVEAKVLVAELLAGPALLETASAALSKYEGYWKGDKARMLRDRLASATAETAVDRKRKLLDRAKELADEGKKSLAEAILAGLVALYPNTEVGEEAQKMLNQLRTGG